MKIVDNSIMSLSKSVKTGFSSQSNRDSPKDEIVFIK